MATATPTLTIQALAVEDLLLDSNIRKTVTLDKPFLASIKSDGVLQPILVTEAEDGKYSVVDGQRRTLAVVDSERTTIPALVIPAVADAARIIKQLLLNDQRTPISDADHTAAFRDLELFGVTADQIARKTRIPKPRVEKALAVANSEVASRVITEHQLTLEQADAFVQLQETPAAVEELLEVATQNPAQFDHAAARLLAQQRQDREKQALVDDLTAKGIGVIDASPDYYDATLRHLDYVYKNKNQTERVKLEDIPIENLRALPFLRWGSESVWEAVYYVHDFTGIGLFSFARTTTQAAGGGLTDEEKARRKISRDNNKLWVPSTQVRLTFIRELLQRKDMPAGWIDAVAEFFVDGQQADYRIRSTIADLLGIDGRGDLTGWYKKNPTRGAAVALAVAFAAIEGEFEFEKKGWGSSSAAAHLARLSKWGYTLSDIEQAVVAGTAKKGLS
jgi:ParB family chromosome partitioning protein